MKKLFYSIIFLCILSPYSYAAEVEFQTSKGNMVFEIDEENAPITAQNFLKYVQEGFYDNLTFHRVIPNFVIQGGGFDSKFNLKQTRDPIVNEDDNGLENLHYTLSMARTNDPNSATSQFFINLKDNSSHLDKQGGRRGYAVFGKVIEGQDVVDAIAVVPTEKQPLPDVPKEPIVILKAFVVNE